MDEEVPELPPVDKLLEDQVDGGSVLRDGLAAARLEKRVVKALMKHGGREEEHKKIIYEHMKVGNQALGVRFSEFHRRYPEFPIFLRFKPIRWLHQMSIADLFKGPARVRDAFFEAGPPPPVGWNGPTGLVFAWLHAGRPLKIVHDYHACPNLSGQRVTWDAADKPDVQNPRLLHLENFTDFLHSIGWT